MFFGVYHFAGRPDTLLPAYQRLMDGLPAGGSDLHVCVVLEHGLSVYDTCPSRQVFEQFSRSEGISRSPRRGGSSHSRC